MALEKAFVQTDNELKKEHYAMEAGTTSCVVLITPDEIYCANAGDSRAVLNRAGKSVELS